MVSLKHKGYWLTFMAYAAIHALRMCYSFNKVNLKRHFGLSQFYLGFLDAILYLSYSFGVLIRYWVFEGNQLMTKTYFITSMMISLFFGFIAYVAIFSEISAFSYLLMKILLTVGVFGFGFFHFTAYQICGSIVSGFYDAKHKKGEIGFWGSNSSVGNIVGFFISNYIIHQLNLRWEVSFFLFAIINLITAFAMYFWLTMPEEDQSYKQQLYLLPHLTQKTSNQQIQQIRKSIQRQIRPIHWFKFIQKLISTSIEARYLYVAYITMKATVYTFLMWFPIFLVSKNLESVSGYISTLFDLGGCAGGYLLGKLHATANQYDELPHHQRTPVLGVILRYRNIVFIIIIATIIILFMILPSSLALYCPLTFFIGFFLGGQFNNISSHQIFSLGENHLLYTDMLLNTSVGVSCFLIGIVQLLTAFLLKWDQKHKKQKEAENYGVFFVVLLIMMVLCGVMTFGRIKVSKKYLEDHKK